MAPEQTPTPEPAPPSGTSLPPLRDVIARHGLSARRSLGQHFLLDMNLTRRIARAAGPLDGRTVVEIGPGPGGLTRALLEAGAHRLIAIERDPRCRPALDQVAEAWPGRLIIVEADALACSPASAGSGDGARIIVANLPYNIATRLLIAWLHDLSGIDSMILMFQKEVAERLVALPGTASYGRLSVITQWLCDAESLFDVTPRAFVPPPKVRSAVVKLVPRAEPVAPAPMAGLEAVTAAAFGQRRKMLRSSLRTLTPEPVELLTTAGISPERRPETLSVEEFCALARAQAARIAAGC